MDADAVEIRVLGCLVEKQRTTPDAYPLTLNSLRLACNQATNRDPVVDLDEASIRDVHSGDLAVMRPDGYVNIVGRVKDMIIRGGENIYPAEIEAFLMRHPKIAEAQIIGLPDEFMGEEVCAMIRRSDDSLTAEELIEHCRANMARYKLPKYIRFVAAYPLTASGKVQKFVLRDQMIRELGLDDVAKLKTA